LDRIDHSKTCCTHELRRLSDGERQKILRRLVHLEVGLNIDETPEMLAAIDAGIRSIETGPAFPWRKRINGWADGSQSNPARHAKIVRHRRDAVRRPRDRRLGNVVAIIF